MPDSDRFLPRSPAPGRPSDAEVIELLRSASGQYEESLRLSRLGRFPAEQSMPPPQRRYDWNNPMGLAITGPCNASIG